jgi:hypothetical protein
MQTGTRQPPISPLVKFRGVSVCFNHFGLFRLVCVIRPKYFFGLLFIYFFLSFHLTGPKSHLNFDLSFFSAPSSSSSFFFFLFSAQLFLCNFSLLFFFWLFAKKKKKERFLVQVPCPSSFFLLPSSSFFFLLLLLSFFRPGLSLSMPFIFFFFFFFFFCLFGSSASLHVMLLDICLKFLLHLHFGVLCTLLFFFFFFFF